MTKGVLAERAAQIDVDRLQKTGLVEGRAIDAVVGRGDRDGAVERVIGGGAREGLAVQSGILRPVRSVLVVARELARAAQRIALEIVEIGGDDAGAVEMLEDLGVQIGLLLLRLGEPRVGAVAVDRALVDDRLRKDRGIGLRLGSPPCTNDRSGRRSASYSVRNA